MEALLAARGVIFDHFAVANFAKYRMDSFDKARTPLDMRNGQSLLGWRAVPNSAPFRAVYRLFTERKTERELRRRLTGHVPFSTRTERLVK